jgi:hypothetical protein
MLGLAAALVVGAPAFCAPINAQGPSVPAIALGGTPARLEDGLDQVRQVRELEDGTLLVLSSRSKVPLHADYATGLVNEVSREGAGPGEFRQPHALMALPGDSSLVCDADRCVILVGTRPVSTRRTWLVHAYGPRFEGADRHGRILEVRPSKYGTQPGTRLYPYHHIAESLAILIHHRAPTGSADAVTARVDTTAHVRGAFRGAKYHVRGSYRGVGVRYGLISLLTGEEQATLFLDGWIAVAYAEPYRVDWITPDGRRIPGAPLPFVEVPVDDVQRKAAVARDFPRSPTLFAPEDYPHWPKVLPPFSDKALLAMPDGRVAIRRQVDARDPATVYDLVDRQGRLTAKLRLKPNENVAGFGRGAVYVIRKDREDLEWIERYSWPPS